MKKLTASLLMMLFAVSLTACAPKTAQEEGARVKCPACGYEFEVPASGGQ